MKILIFDNYDSFTYNIVHAVRALGYGAKLEVHRNDKIALSDIKRFDKIILSPGPGIPSEAGILQPLIKEYAPSKSIFGVCLGEQAIGEVFGGSLKNLKDVYHGVSTPIIIKDDDYIFEGLPKTFEAGRYHSWIVAKENLPACIKVTAEDPQGAVMALRHTSYDVRGVQFHPESVLTPLGVKIIENWLKA